MGRSLQNLAEEKAYDILFELENELEIDTKKLPEVRYIDKNFNFDRIGIDTRQYPEIHSFKKHETGFYSIEDNIIMINSLKDSIMGEEVGHFIHHNFVNDFSDIVNNFGAKAIGEMIGFFCSKLIDSRRESAYKEDNFKSEKLIKDKLFHLAYIGSLGEEDALIHQQGYILGKALYNKYLIGAISKENIRSIIQDSLEGQNRAFMEFLNLREMLVS